MDSPVAFRGGARLGWVQGTWPFGLLSISPGQLTISLAFADRYIFAPSEVSGLERCGIASNGVRIVHTRADYSETVIFWCGARVQHVLDSVALAGFPVRLPASPPRRGIPFRWIAIAQVLVACNVVALVDGSLQRWSVPRAPGLAMIAALAMLLGVAFAVQISEAAQAWALKPGRSVSEVAPFLRFAQLIGGFLLAGMVLQKLF